MENQKFYYDNKIVKYFILATIIWGVVAVLVGVLIALQLAFPAFNFGLEYTSFGRVRPIHTNAVIFAFVGNAIFAGVYYSLQKLLKARMFSDVLSKVHFWGWQLIIVLAAVTFVLGFTTSKEYAELEWPIDILVAVVWVVFGWNMIGTIVKRRVQHIYAAIWWYLATFLGIAILHIVNSFELPISLFKSYSIYAGAQDAVVQWWYGHNAVAFFLTTPFLGLMYYFLPKAANRPIYSYRLSIIHFWSLIFLYVGRTSPLALPGFARMGAGPGGYLLHNANRPLLGRDDKRSAHSEGSLGPGARQCSPEVPGGCSDCIWSVHLRGPHDVAKECEYDYPLHRLDHCPYPHCRDGLEWWNCFRNALLSCSQAVPNQDLLG